MRPAFRLVGLLLAAFGATCLALPAHQGAASAETQTLVDRIVRRGALRVGVTGDYRPFDWRNHATGIYEGFDIDQAGALAAALGVRAEFVQTTWSTLAADFAADRFDIAMGGVSITPERAARGYFSIPYMQDGKTPIARCADKDKYADLAEIDRPDVRVIVNPGGANERFARAHLKRAPIRVFPDNRTLFEEIAEGRADVMVTDASEARYQARRHPGVLCAVHPDAPFERAEKAYWMQPDESLKTFVDAWLHTRLETGAVHALTTRWMN